MLTRNSGGSTHLPIPDSLAARVPEMHLKSATLNDCVAQLSRVSGMQIVVDGALGDPNQYAMDFDAPPSTLGKDLEVLFNSCGISCAAWRDGARVRVVPVGMVPRSLRIYDIRDIRRKLTEELWEEELAAASRPPPQYGLFGGSASGGGAQQGLFAGSNTGGRVPSPNPAGWAATEAEAMDVIVKCVEDNVTPQDWVDNGGSGAGAAVGGGYLAVYGTAAAHRAVAQLLRAIRAADSIRWTQFDHAGAK